MFNVAQTNLQQVRPEIYAKLEEQCAVKLHVQDGEIFSFPALDAMIENNAWNLLMRSWQKIQKDNRRIHI